MMVVELTPKELFFLAKAMKAKYMDYAYIAMMEDIQMNYDVSEIESLESLAEKGYAEADFGGDLEIDPEVAEIMQPVFFGEIECLIKMNDKKIRIHQMDNSMISSVTDDERHIMFSKITDAELNGYLNDDIDIQCSNVQKGTYIKSYSKTELSDMATRNEAKKITKGEW